MLGKYINCTDKVMSESSVVLKANYEYVVHLKDNVDPWKDKMREACEEFVEMFTSMAPIDDLEKNIERQVECFNNLLDRESVYFYGSFHDGCYSNVFRNYHESEIYGSLYGMFRYAVVMKSISLLQWLFKKIGREITYKGFSRMVEEAITTNQLDIVHFLFNTILERTDIILMWNSESNKSKSHISESHEAELELNESTDSKEYILGIIEEVCIFDLWAYVYGSSRAGRGLLP
jgi:hypothetical protein